MYGCDFMYALQKETQIYSYDISGNHVTLA